MSPLGPPPRPRGTGQPTPPRSACRSPGGSHVRVTEIPTAAPGRHRSALLAAARPQPAPAMAASAAPAAERRHRPVRGAARTGLTAARRQRDRAAQQPFTSIAQAAAARAPALGQLRRDRPPGRGKLPADPAADLHQRRRRPERPYHHLRGRGRPGAGHDRRPAGDRLAVQNQSNNIWVATSAPG